MTSKKVAKPILKPEQDQEKTLADATNKSQLDQLQQLLYELRRQEQILQEREEKLYIRGEELEAREKEVARRERPTLRPKNKNLEVQPASSLPETIQRPKLKKRQRAISEDSTSLTSPQQLAETSSVRLASGASIPIPAFTPEPTIFPMFAHTSTTQTSQDSMPPATFVSAFPKVSE